MAQDFNNQDLEFIFSTVSAVDFLQMYFVIQLLSKLGRLNDMLASTSSKFFMLIHDNIGTQCSSIH